MLIDVFNCLPAEKALTICKRKLMRKFCLTNNELCKIVRPTYLPEKELATF